MTRAIACVVALVWLLAACGDDSLPEPGGDSPTLAPETSQSSTPSPTLAPSTATPSTRTPAATPDPPADAGPSPLDNPVHVLIGAGDIASCTDGAELTAQVLDAMQGAVFTAGDNAYPEGTESDFQRCYEPAWGRHKERTRPAPGNHDYASGSGAAYFAYFGAAAGEPGRGYYTYNLGPWHVVVLNSVCGAAGGCGPGSPQHDWLLADLEAHPAVCTLAIWHHPVVTAGPHEPDETGVLPLWQALHDAGAELVVSGHDHNYQRFAPLDRDATGAGNGGIRLIIAGTGGAGIYDIDPQRAAQTAGLEVWADAAGDGDGRDSGYGVLKLTLATDSYEWEFVPARGTTFTDRGSDNCT